MKTTKKIISIGLCAAMLAGAALAEGTTTVSGNMPSAAEQQQIQEQNRQGQPPQMPGMNGQNQHGQPPQMPGMNGQNQQGQPPQMPGMNGQNQQGQPPQMPGMNGQNQQGQPPEMPSGEQNANQQSNQPPEMPSAEQNANQQSNQPPEMPEMGSQDQQGQPPQMPGADSENDPTAVVQTGNGGQLKMRQEPSQESRIDSYLKNGTEVEVLDVQDDWVKIRVNGKEGYVMIDFLEGNLQTQEETEQNGQQEGQMPDMPEMNGQNQQGQPPEMPSGEQPGNQQGQPPEMPGGQPGGMPGGMPGDMSTPADYAAAATVTESSDGTEYSSTSDSENAVLVSGSEVTISNATVTKTGSSNGDSADFYGINASVLAKDGATLTVEGTTIISDGAHANGVFSYGQGTTVNVSDTSITTTGNNSGGLMTTGGATLNATNVIVNTSGNSSAAIRSDRGGGTVNVDGGSYSSSGVGSPAIYSTADISVSNATLASATSEAVVIEGGNTVNLTDVSISGSNSTLNGQSTVKTNVLIYQSMSGDAAEGDSAFTMTGGSMVSETGSMFHVTNTTTVINLDHVEFTYAEDSNVFLDASADSWGRTGSNGGNVTLNLTNQDISGAILSDSVSSVCVSLDSNSTWTLQGDSYISGFTGDLANVNLNGYTLYVNGVAVTK